MSLRKPGVRTSLAPAFPTSSNLYEFRGGRRQEIDASVGDHNIVFDSNTAPSGEIRARLNRKDHACNDRLVVAHLFRPSPPDARILVYFDPEPVSCSMTKGRPQTAP